VELEVDSEEIYNFIYLLIVHANIISILETVEQKIKNNQDSKESRTGESNLPSNL
jgi:hypothetical protein